MFSKIGDKRNLQKITIRKLKGCGRTEPGGCGGDRRRFRSMKTAGTGKRSDYFVLTTNVDHCFQKAGFDKKRLFYTQGDYGLWQCAGPCHSKTYDNEAVVRQMVTEQREMRIPADLVPRCPKCGGPLRMNLRCDDTFVEDKGWQMAADRYEDFIRRHAGLRVVYLELGVGANTPGIIKYPFWQMTAGNENTMYACVNLGEAYCPCGK